MITRLRDLSLLCLASMALYARAEEPKNDYGVVIGIGNIILSTDRTVFLSFVID